jgi:hypothetical protein
MAGPVFLSGGRPIFFEVTKTWQVSKTCQVSIFQVSIFNIVLTQF